MTDQDLIALALTHIDATEHALGEYGHFFSYQEQPGSCIVYLVNDDDMADLGQRLASGERDAYSCWCSDTSATERNIEAAIFAHPGAADWDAVEREATANGDVNVLAVLAHLRADLDRLSA